MSRGCTACWFLGGWLASSLLKLLVLSALLLFGAQLLGLCILRGRRPAPPPIHPFTTRPPTHAAAKEDANAMLDKFLRQVAGMYQAETGTKVRAVRATSVHSAIVLPVLPLYQHTCKGRNTTNTSNS